MSAFSVLWLPDGLHWNTQAEGAAVQSYAQKVLLYVVSALAVNSHPEPKACFESLLKATNKKIFCSGQLLSSH